MSRKSLWTMMLGGATALCMTSLAQANTIQAITDASPTHNGNGTWTFHYALELTGNNGLVDGGDQYRSLLDMLDFNGLDGSNLFKVAGDVTNVVDWTESNPLVGANLAPNTDYGVTSAGKTTLTGLQPNAPIGNRNPTASNFDDPGVKNVVLEYAGAGLNIATNGRTLIHLDLTSRFSPGASIVTLSRDTARISTDPSIAAGTKGSARPVETFLADAPVAVPVPGAFWAGGSLLGLMGLSKVRRQMTERTLS